MRKSNKNTEIKQKQEDKNNKEINKKNMKTIRMDEEENGKK